MSVVDIATGMHAYEAILEALIARGRTGEGADIRVSMFDSMMEWMAIPMLYTEHGAPPKRLGLTHPTVAPYGVFQSADGVPDPDLGPERPRMGGAVQQGPEAAGARHRPALCHQPRAHRQPRRDRRRRWRTISPAAPWRRCRASWTAAQIAFARVNTVEDILRHPHLRRVAVASPWGDFAVPASPARFAGEAEPGYGPLPALGPAHGGGAAGVPRACRVGCNKRQRIAPAHAQTAQCGSLLRPTRCRLACAARPFLYVEGRAVASRTRVPDRSRHENRHAAPHPAQGLPPARAT